MIRSPRLGAAILLSLLGAAGCVSEEQHDRALAEIKRLQLDSAQRTYEAAQLRQLLDRITVELRTREPVDTELVRRYSDLAAHYNELTARCTAPAPPLEAARPDPLPPLPMGPFPRVPAPAPTGRQVGDRLFDDRQ